MAGTRNATGAQIKRDQPNSIAGSAAERARHYAGDAAPRTIRASPSTFAAWNTFGRVNILVDGARQDYQISGHNANGTFYFDPQLISQADVVP